MGQICTESSGGARGGVYRASNACSRRVFRRYPRPKLQVNRRMCADCHELFKVVSAALDVRIECLDAARLHVFADGACTCGDVQQERAARRPAAQSGGRAASPSRARGAVDRSELQRGRTPRQGG
eukprot:6174932-Pleurochrysis_carterae.AAC.2